MKKRLLSLLLAVIMCVSLLAVPASAAGISGAKTTSALNLRSGASTSKSIIMTMPAGAEVIVGMTQNGWCKVVYNNTVGYASADYLKTVSKVSGNFGTGTVSGSDVRMRSGAGTNSSVITTLDKGTKMSVIGASGNWYEVSYNGKTGYMAIVKNTTAPAEQWIAGGVPITMMMNMERRHGEMKPVIKKALVRLDGAPFKTFAAHREEWAEKTCFVYPGPIQYFGPTEVCDQCTMTLKLEQGK